MPTAARVGVLVNPANPPVAQSTVRDVQTAADSIGLQMHILNASTIREIDAAYMSLVRERADALLVGSDVVAVLRCENLEAAAQLEAGLEHVQVVVVVFDVEHFGHVADSVLLPAAPWLPRHSITSSARARSVAGTSRPFARFVSSR
jgi:hypothetical protein